MEKETICELEMDVIPEERISENEYSRFVQPYQDAMQNLYSRINILNADYRRKYKNYAIHNTQYRIKKLDSAIGKLERKGYSISIEDMKTYIRDIAGIRIICYFVEDIYSVIQLLKQQSDLLILDEEDYIKNPKESGYKGYHIILGIPIYYIDGKQYYPVEVQLRTMGMDFWASMEHRICYKKESELPESVHKKIFHYSEMLDDMERKMSELCKKVNDR